MQFPVQFRGEFTTISKRDKDLDEKFAVTARNMCLWDVGDKLMAWLVDYPQQPFAMTLTPVRECPTEYADIGAHGIEVLAEITGEGERTDTSVDLGNRFTADKFSEDDRGVLRDNLGRILVKYLSKNEKTKAVVELIEDCVVTPDPNKPDGLLISTRIRVHSAS